MVLFVVDLNVSILVVSMRNKRREGRKRRWRGEGGGRTVEGRWEEGGRPKVEGRREDGRMFRGGGRTVEGRGRREDG
ncbi:hypothetical protein LINPERPRIM_LOCUS37537 [Linum perenne]